MYRQVKGKGKFVLMVSPRLILPEDLKKEIFLVDFDLPDEAEVRNAIAFLGKRHLGEGGLRPADADRVAPAGEIDGPPGPDGVRRTRTGWRKVRSGDDR